MLPKPFRLHAERDFSRVFKYGRTLAQGVLVFKNGPNNLPVSRFGVVISNAVLKKAHDRNRAKRLIRAVLLKHYKNFIGGKDVVLIARKGIEKETFASLGLAIPWALQKIGVLPLQKY